MTFSLAAKAANGDTAYWSKKLADSGTVVWKLRPPTSDEMRRARYYELGKVSSLPMSDEFIYHKSPETASWLSYLEGCYAAVTTYSR